MSVVSRKAYALSILALSLFGFGLIADRSPLLRFTFLYPWLNLALVSEAAGSTLTGCLGVLVLSRSLGMKTTYVAVSVFLLFFVGILLDWLLVHRPTGLLGYNVFAYWTFLMFIPASSAVGCYIAFLRC